MVVALSGGAPWGFRLQGGAEQRKPLQVAKVRGWLWQVGHGWHGQGAHDVWHGRAGQCS